MSVIKVGIVTAEQIQFRLNGDYLFDDNVFGEGEETVTATETAIRWRGQLYHEILFTPKEASNASFSLSDVTIGVDFHWQRQETQTFRGSLRLINDRGRVCAINILPLEEYLKSVISSEMSATASLPFLKAHAVISRSWLLAQISKSSRVQGSRVESQGSRVEFQVSGEPLRDNEISASRYNGMKGGSHIRWYDREDHTLFDVCADDHCQRYQGITRASSPAVAEAIRQTRGQVLVYAGELCDARFSKCCGGRTEEFQYCWEDTPKPSLVSVVDPFCNTKDKRVLKQVLNDYDQETPDFYRWRVEYTREQLTELVNRNLKMDLGDILDLVPLDRGKSGRIWRLKIVGSKRTFIIGKELEIRRTLSESHLYSSDFDVEQHGDRIILNGRGWGHGVGLCQIGAAVMGEKGYGYDEILLYYYRGAEIKQVY